MEAWPRGIGGESDPYEHEQVTAANTLYPIPQTMGIREGYGAMPCGSTKRSPISGFTKKYQRNEALPTMQWLSGFYEQQMST